MKIARLRFFLAFVLSIVCISAIGLARQSAAAQAAQAPVTISVNVTNAGIAIPTNYVGLSFEVTQLLTNEDGVHYFRPDNQPLIDLFQTLGVKSLRIGGNTSDRDVRKLPDETDLDSFFGFAKAAKVKVIYCLRLRNADVQDDISTAKYIMDHYAAQMDCFSIGQEPSAYPKLTNAVRSAEGMGEEYEKYSYTNYAPDWKIFADALVAAVPGIKFAGPSVHNNGEWARRFMDDFGKSNNVVLITEHLYPGGAGNKITNAMNAMMAIDRMLAKDNSDVTNPFPKVYQKLYESFVPEAISNGLPYRLEEVNNYFNGGAAKVSDTFASALWGLDFLYWWAAHNAAGINFHTGDKVAAGASLQASKYTAYFTSTNGYYIRPLGYGIKAFDLGAHGKFLSLTISNTNLNLTAYAVDGGGTVHVTIINKEHGTNAQDADVTINLNNDTYKYAEAVFLAAPTNENETATSGIMLGGAAIQNDGSWDGKWSIVKMQRRGVFHVKVPACSAVVVACMTANYDESKVGTFTLPDPLTFKNGDPVLDSNDWTDNRRPEILKQYEGYIYGSAPKWRNMIDRTWEADATAFGGKATRKQVELEFYNYNGIHLGQSNNLTLHVLLYMPNAVTNRVPVFLCLSFSPNYRDVDDPKVAVYPVWDRKTNSLSVMPEKIERANSHNWPVEKIIDRGYGIALLDYNEIEPDLDDGTGWKYGVRSLYVKPGQTNFDADAWGAIGAWAWGASRVLDYLQTDRQADPNRIIMVGQSRLGKTALWAGAEDPRFAMVIASCSGEMGAALARRDYGETVTSMCTRYAYQFCPNFLFYSNSISDMPVDSHMLISLIAPRPLFLNTGTEDRWSDPRGEWEAAIAAAPVYRLFDEQSVITNFPPNDPTNQSGSLLNSATLETYPMPPVDIPVMRDVAFHEHTGKHDIYSSDWDKFLDFADMHFYGKPPRHYTGEKPQIDLPPPLPMDAPNTNSTAISVIQTTP